MKTKKENKKEVVPHYDESGRILGVTFTIPTNFSYESVKVETAGFPSVEAMDMKYAELVDTFRPKPKLAPVKEKMPPYNVNRKVPAADDEAGGAVIRDETKDEETINLQKLDVVALLEDKHAFMCKGKTRKEIADKVFDITGLMLADDNLERIIDALKK